MGASTVKLKIVDTDVPALHLNTEDGLTFTACQSVTRYIHLCLFLCLVGLDPKGALPPVRCSCM